MKRKTFAIMAVTLVFLMVIGLAFTGCAEKPSKEGGEDLSEENGGSEELSEGNNSSNDPDKAPVKQISPPEPEPIQLMNTFRINCGDSGFQDKFGNEWEANYGDDYIPGQYGLVKGSIHKPENPRECGGTELPEVYYVNVWNTSNLTYKFDNIMPGTYSVKLYMAEQNFEDGADNSRIFDVVINNRVYDENICPSEDVGMWNAVEREYIIKVDENETLTVSLISSRENPSLSGIEIVPAEGDTVLSSWYTDLSEFELIDTIRVNCGSSEQIEDSNGNIWLADQAFLGTGWGYSNEGNNGTSTGYSVSADKVSVDTRLYQSVRWGKITRYTFENLKPGDYIVNVYFIDEVFPEVGTRVFAAYMYELLDGKVNNDTRIEDPIDLAALVGRYNPYEVTGTEFTLSEDAHMVVEFEGLVENSVICAIEIIPK